jgi:hypothetical protein
MYVVFILGLHDKVLPWDIEYIIFSFQAIEDDEEDGLADFLGPGPSKRRKEHY